MPTTVLTVLTVLTVPTVQDPLRISSELIAPGFVVISGYTNGNILAVVGDSGILLVDAQSTKRVAQADSALRRYSVKPVRYVVNTHYHGDHVEGNAFYRERGALVIAQERVRVEASKDTTIKELEWHRVAALPAALPDVTFGDTLTLHLPEGAVQLIHAPRAHTGGDAVVWFPKANIVHAGDIVEIAAPPFLDWWSGGSLDGMIAAVDSILRRADARTRIVPGHGPVIGRTELLAYRHMLATVRERLGQAIAAGKTLEEIHAQHITAEFDSAMGGERQTKRFVAILHLGLAPRRSGSPQHPAASQSQARATFSAAPHAASLNHRLRLESAFRRDRAGHALVGGVIGGAAGIITCTVISNIMKDPGTGFSTCTTKGYALLGLSGFGIGALIGALIP